MDIINLAEANRIANKIQEINRIQNAKRIRVQYAMNDYIEDSEWETVPNELTGISVQLHEALVRGLESQKNALEYKLARL